MSESYDWGAIRADYESGQFSLRQLAGKYGVSKTYLIERRNKEQWNRPPTTFDRPDNSQRVIPPTRDANAAMRVVKAVELRQAGLTYEQIAHQCGYASPGAARNAVQNELNRVVTQEIETWRNDQISRLEKMHEEVWLIAMNREAKGRLFAFDRLLLIAERQAKLLGLDATKESVPAQVVVRETPAGYLASPEVQS